MVQINSVSRFFKTDKVLDELSLDLPDGKITALVGKNGSGKTTLIRLISGLIKADSGIIDLGNSSSIGVLLGGDIHLYEKLTGYENIKYFSILKGMDNKSFEKRCNYLSDVLEFKSFMYRKAECFSRGMKQKIAFAIAIINDPQILLLDEPSTGLDVSTSVDVINLINLCKNENKTVLISTHNISEILYLSDYIAILKNGKINLFKETVDVLKNQSMEDALRYISSKI